MKARIERWTTPCWARVQSLTWPRGDSSMYQAEEGILRQGQLERHGHLGYGEQVAQDRESQNPLLTSIHRQRHKKQIWERAAPTCEPEAFFPLSLLWRVFFNLATCSNHLGVLKIPGALANEIAHAVRGTQHPSLNIPKEIQVGGQGWEK